LRLVAPADAKPTPLVRFCGQCAATPAEADIRSRICGRCQMGVVLEAVAELAPRPGDAFIVVDSHLGINALSEAASALLGVSEDDALHRPIGDLLAPADVAGNGVSNLNAALLAHDGPELVRELVVRPAGVFGVRFRARVGRVGQPLATLVVLERFGVRRRRTA
jgi:PAS domain-containing protein